MIAVDSIDPVGESVNVTCEASFDAVDVVVENDSVDKNALEVGEKNVVDDEDGLEVVENDVADNDGLEVLDAVDEEGLEVVEGISVLGELRNAEITFRDENSLVNGSLIEDGGSIEL